MIKVFKSPDTLAVAVAELFIEEAKKAIRLHSRFTVALSGGETPKKSYELLKKHPDLNTIDWEKVHIFWGDDRCVPLNSPLSNYKMAKEALLDHVPVPASQVHPLLCYDHPKQSALQYEATLKNHQKNSNLFDLVLLGLGENGHTASLFPNDPALKETNSWILPVKVATDSFWRVTLTPPCLEKTNLTVFLVTGAHKAQALKEVLVGDGEVDLWPAKLFVRKKNIYWFIDNAAADLLPIDNLKT